MAGDRFDSELGLALENRGRNWVVSVPGKRYVEELRSLAALPAAGAYELTDPVDVFKSRDIHLYLTVEAAAIGNIVSIVPEVSLDPAGTDESFFPMGIADAVITDTDLGAAPSSDYVGTHFNSMTYRPLEIRTAATDAADDKVKLVVTLNVNHAYYVRFRVAEAGVDATPATVGLSFAKSV